MCWVSDMFLLHKKYWCIFQFFLKIKFPPCRPQSQGILPPASLHPSEEFSRHFLFPRSFCCFSPAPACWYLILPFTSHSRTVSLSHPWSNQFHFSRKVSSEQKREGGRRWWYILKWHQTERRPICQTALGYFFSPVSDLPSVGVGLFNKLSPSREQKRRRQELEIVLWVPIVSRIS